MKTLMRCNRGWMAALLATVFTLSFILFYVNSPVFASSFQGLGYLPGFPYSDALSASADGSVVVGFATDRQYKYQAFRWTSGGGMVGLGYLPDGIESNARGVSADGSVIVGYGFSSEYVGNAFIWDPIHGMDLLQDVLQNEYALDLTGWTLTVANGITPDGFTIVGRGIHNGIDEAWIARLADPVPLPGSLLLLGSGLLGLVGWRRFRKG